MSYNFDQEWEKNRIIREELQKRHNSFQEKVAREFHKQATANNEFGGFFRGRTQQAPKIEVAQFYDDRWPSLEADWTKISELAIYFNI